MNGNPALGFLKAAADPSRLRLLGLLASGEATVGELSTVLDQSQPRVSRHLKILADAHLVSHFRDGQWMYYRLDPAPALKGVAEQVIGLARRHDDSMPGDQARMAEMRRGRERYALAVPSGSSLWAEHAGDRPDAASLAQVLDAALAPGPLGDVLDIGVGAGKLLRLLAPRARQAVGLDTARTMRVLARSRLQQAGLAHCTIRAGDMNDLPFPELSFDVVVLDEVLSVAADPRPALAEALRVLRPAGRLLIFDRILPAARRLPGSTARRALYENQLVVMLGALGLKSRSPVWFPGRSLDYALLTASAALPAARTSADE